MRLLDLHHGQRGEERSKKPNLASVYARDKQIEEEDREQISQRGELTAQYFYVELICRFCRDAHYRHRQITVDEERISTVVGVESRSLAVEIFPYHHPALLLGRTRINRYGLVHTGVRPQTTENT